MGRGGFPVYTRTRRRQKRSLYRWYGNEKKPFIVPPRYGMRARLAAVAGTIEFFRLLYMPVPRTLPSSPHLIKPTLRTVGLFGSMGEGKTSNAETIGNAGTLLFGLDPIQTQKLGSKDMGLLSSLLDGLENTISILDDAGQTLSGRHGGMSHKRKSDLDDYTLGRHRKNVPRLVASPHDPSGLYLIFLNCQYYKMLDVVIRGNLSFKVFKGIPGSDAEMAHFVRQTHGMDEPLECLIDITNRRAGGDQGANGEGVWISKAGHCGHLNLRHMFGIINQPLWEYVQGEGYARDPLWYAEQLGVLHGYDPDYKPDELHLMLWEMDPRPPLGSFGLIKTLYKGMILKGLRNGTLSESEGAGRSKGAVIAKFHTWIRERCRLVPGASTPFSLLWADYYDYTTGEGLGTKGFAQALTGLKIHNKRDTKGQTFRDGIMLVDYLLHSLD